MRITKLLLPTLTTVLAFGCFQIGYAQSGENKLPKSMKGYELYSWKIRGEWYFSLLVGTNRRKTLDEIISRKARVKGIDALKKKLSLLATGEEVIMSVGSGSIPQLIFPPREIMNEITRYCEQHDLILIIPAVRTNIFDKPDKRLSL